MAFEVCCHPGHCPADCVHHTDCKPYIHVCMDALNNSQYFVSPRAHTRPNCLGSVCVLGGCERKGCGLGLQCEGLAGVASNIQAPRSQSLVAYVCQTLVLHRALAFCSGCECMHFTPGRVLLASIVAFSGWWHFPSVVCHVAWLPRCVCVCLEVAQLGRFRACMYICIYMYIVYVYTYIYIYTSRYVCT